MTTRLRSPQFALLQGLRGHFREVDLASDRLSPAEIDRLLTELLNLQGNRWALTGIPFTSRRTATKTYRPLLTGSTAAANIRVEHPGGMPLHQLLKGTADNDDFTRLLSLVRNGGDERFQG